MKAKEGLHIDFIIYVKKRLYKCIFVYAQPDYRNNMSSRVKLTMFTGM